MSDPIQDLLAIERVGRSFPEAAWMSDRDLRFWLRLHLDETGSKTPRSFLQVVDGDSQRPVRDIDEAVRLFRGTPAFWQNVIDWGDV